MNPLNALIVKKLNDKLEQLHNDNQRIIALLENIAEKEKIVIRVTNETHRRKHVKLSNYEKTLWEMF